MPSVTINGYTWYDYPRPTEEDLKELQAKHDFHDLDIEDCLSEHERPKVEEYDHYLFLVFHIQFFLKSTGRILKEEVNIFMGRDFLITLHEGRIPLFETLRESLEHPSEKDKEFFHQGTSFLLYELMSQLFESGFPIVDSIMRQLRIIESQLFEEEDEADVLRDILNLQRNIIMMRSILLPQRSLVALLEHRHRKFIDEDLDIYFDNILDAIERQWALLDTAKEMSEALQETHESWLSHRTNTTIRVLTVINVLSLPPLIITGFYGMNVPLPAQNQQLAYVGLIIAMLIIGAATLWYAMRKKWL